MEDTEDEAVSGPDFLDVLNELGGQGWEVIGETIRESTVGRSRGWFQAGYPIVRQWLLKRPVAESGA